MSPSPLKRLGSQLPVLHILIGNGVIFEILHQNHVTLDCTVALPSVPECGLVTWEQ
jgi:hypothetical protein